MILIQENSLECECAFCNSRIPIQKPPTKSLLRSWRSVSNHQNLKSPTSSIDSLRSMMNFLNTKENQVKIGQNLFLQIEDFFVLEKINQPNRNIRPLVISQFANRFAQFKTELFKTIENFCNTVKQAKLKMEGFFNTFINHMTKKVIIEEEKLLLTLLKNLAETCLYLFRIIKVLDKKFDEFISKHLKIVKGKEINKLCQSEKIGEFFYGLIRNEIEIVYDAKNLLIFFGCSSLNPIMLDININFHSLAQDFITSQKYECALSVYQTILEMHPKDNESLYFVGFCKNRLKNYKESVDVFTTCINSEKDESKKFEIMVERGHSYFSLGNFKNALLDVSLAFSNHQIEDDFQHYCRLAVDKSIKKCKEKLFKTSVLTGINNT